MGRRAVRAFACSLVVCGLTLPPLGSRAEAAAPDAAPPPSASPTADAPAAGPPPSDPPTGGPTPEAPASPPVETPAPSPTGEGWTTDDAVAPASTKAPAPAPAPPPETSPGPRLPEAPPLDDEERELRYQSKSAKTMIVAGYATGGSGLGVGLVFTGGALILAEISDSRAREAEEGETVLDRDPETFRQRSRNRRRFALVTGAISGALIITGATLLGVGYDRRKRAEDGMLDKARRQRATSRLSPWVGADSGGLLWHGRF